MFRLEHKPLDTLSVSSAFGMRDYLQMWWHNGIDYRCAIGTPVYAAAAGTVKAAKNNPTGYGLYVAIWHGVAGTLYGHLSRYLVTVGQKVKAGDLIGYSGITGVTGGPHLHFEIRLCRSYDSNFWERSAIDNKVFMRCIDPAIFMDDLLERSEPLTVADANLVVQTQAGLEAGSMQYLNYYEYDDALITKLAKAML